MTDCSRTFRLRTALGESQERFGLRIGCSQGTVYRLENGQPETRPQRMLLDAVERDLAEGRIGPAGVANEHDANGREPEPARGHDHRNGQQAELVGGT